MDITLADLMIIEPRLTVQSPFGAGDNTQNPLMQTEVSWAVAVRATPPHLPVLRGGELVLFPERIAAMLGPDLSALMREAAARQASAGVLELGPHKDGAKGLVADGLQLLVWRGELIPEVETALNRRLTEFRGELYRMGSELERQIADLAANLAGVAPFVRAVAETLGLPIEFISAGGKTLATACDEDPSDATDDGAMQDVFVERSFPAGGTVRLGPLRGQQRVVARFFSARIGTAAAAALQRDDDARPRGPHRVQATEALLGDLNGRLSDQRAAALALGLDPDAMFLVAVCQGGNEAMIARALAPLGAVHPAGGLDGQRSVLVAVNGATPNQSLSTRVSGIKKRWEAHHVSDGATLALSAPALGVASLPGAAKEARFVAMLQTQTSLPRHAASFESVDDVGALRLLYQLRESNELKRFVTEALGSLEQLDRRGTLRATLRAFLESGGSQVDASQRLGIHRNTLAYRLRRIGELVGRDVADPSSWLTLHLAIRASEMLDAFADRG